MENDSVHSAIETAKKKTSVYVPSQWHTVITLARRKNPYVVIPIKYDDITDFKTYTNKVCPNMKALRSGVRVNWLKIRWLQVRKDEDKSIFVNYNFRPENFMELKTQKKTRKQLNAGGQKLLYNAKLPISSAKKKDLLSLCESGIIPEDLHGYYRSLPVVANMKELLPLPDDADDMDDDDEQ